MRSVRWITTSRSDQENAGRAIFVAVGMVSTSTLQDSITTETRRRHIDLLVPRLFLEQFQTCLCVVFDKWDGHMCSDISNNGIKFGADCMLFNVFHVDAVLIIRYRCV